LVWENIRKYLEILEEWILKTIFDIVVSGIEESCIIQYLDTIWLRISTYLTISFIEVEYIPASEFSDKFPEWSLFPFFLDELFVVVDIFLHSTVFIKEKSSILVSLFDITFSDSSSPSYLGISGLGVSVE
jgi:hypothetical protein